METPVTAGKTEFFTPGTQIASSVYATPADAFENAGSPTPKAGQQGTPMSAQSSQKKKGGGKKAHSANEAADGSKFPDEIPSSTWGSEAAPINTQTSVATPTPANKNTQIRFDSEGPVPAAKPPTANVENQEPPHLQESPGDDDDASDSDEEPEMVTAVTAASKAKTTAEETARAHKAQQEKEELRKQQRTARIAEEQAAKRKREVAKAQKLAKQQAREEKDRRKERSSARDVDLPSLPALLPDSVLEAAGERRPPTPPPVRPGKTSEEKHREKLNRQIKFLEQSEKPVKDVKRGNINVSVLSKQNALLVPKANRNTKNIREQWLKGRQQDKKAKKGAGKVSFGKMERRPVGGGFLRGGDD